MLLSALLSCSLFLAVQEPTAQSCSESAWSLVPAYTGDTRSYLSVDLERNVQAAAHLLEAGITLEPDNLLCLWRLGHVESLLAENCRNRGRTAEAQEHSVAAMDVLGRALEQDPRDPWNSYAMGIACTNVGEHERALVFLGDSVREAKARMENSNDVDSNNWLRFKAMEWQCNVAMQAQQPAEARIFMGLFHGEFSSNLWPFKVALAESYSREWHLKGARKAYEEAKELFPEDDQAHTLLGYVEGLLGNDQLAVEHIQRGIGMERAPSMYSRLWLMILAKNEVRAAAAKDLLELLNNPPGSIGPWDARLGRFLLGEGTNAEFIDAGKTEMERRMDTQEAVDDLMCEVYFYAGLRLEWQDVNKGIQNTSALTAQDCYQLALREVPSAWKWEWAYSRLRFAQLAEETQPVNTSFKIDGDQFRSAELDGTIQRLTWSTSKSERPVETLDREPRNGDILMVTVKDTWGKIFSVVRVVGAEPAEN